MKRDEKENKPNQNKQVDKSKAWNQNDPSKIIMT